MSSLSAQRCFHHAQREAAARCPSCKRTYCRECITEHDDRVICATCLRQQTDVPQDDPAWQGLGASFWSVCRTLVALVILWLLFYLMGRGLLNLPDAFHDGTIWGAS